MQTIAFMAYCAFAACLKTVRVASVPSTGPLSSSDCMQQFLGFDCNELCSATHLPSAPSVSGKVVKGSTERTALTPNWASNTQG